VEPGAQAFDAPEEAVAMGIDDDDDGGGGGGGAVVIIASAVLGSDGGGAMICSIRISAWVERPDV
jgi:hypothetical protein